MEKQKTVEQLDKDQDKDLQKKIQSYIEVARHQLGRTPTFEEVQGLMSASAGQDPSSQESPESPESPEPEMSKSVTEDSEITEDDLDEHPGDPSILGMKVYHGMSDAAEGKERSPDERKILFYEDPEGMVYDCGRQEWMDNRPAVLDHLNSRSMYGDDQDIVAAIANGVMGDEDYDSLEKAGMVGEMPKKLWSLTKKLQNQVSDLEKAGVAEDLEKSEENEEVEDDSGYESAPEYDYDSQDIQTSDDQELSGTDNVQEMIKAAVAEATLGKYFENRVRSIVSEMMGGGQQESIEIDSGIPELPDIDEEF